MRKLSVLLASATLVISMTMATNIYVKNLIPQDLRNCLSSNVHFYFSFVEELSHLGINPDTPLFKSETDSSGRKVMTYLTKDNLPVVFKYDGNELIRYNQTTAEETEEINRLAKLLFGEDVVCAIPSEYTDRLVVQIHGGSYTYDEGVLERVP